MMDGPARWFTITSDGVLHGHGDQPTLERLGEEINGTLEVIPFPAHSSHGAAGLWINKDGEDPDGNHLELNPRASAFFMAALWPGQRLVGTVAVTGEPDEDANMADVDEAIATRLRSMFGQEVMA